MSLVLNQRNCARIEYFLRRLWLPVAQSRRWLGNWSEGYHYNFFPRLGCVFVHVPKTAGMSVHAVFSQFENSCTERAPDPVIEKLKKSRLPMHAKAKELRAVTGSRAWANLYSVSFVRNPWDLMVSCYFWWLQHAHKFSTSLKDAVYIRRMSFKEFLDSPYGRYQLNEFYGDMEDWFQHEGQDIVSYIGCFETLENDMQKIMGHLGVDPKAVQLPHSNKSDRNNYRDYYTSETKELVGERFENIIARFGYQF